MVSEQRDCQIGILLLMQLTSGPNVVHIWLRNPQKIEATKPSNSTEWSRQEVKWDEV